MSASTDVLVRSDGGMSWHERAGRAIMWLAVLAAAGAAGTALLSVLDAGSATKVVETWRLCGLVVFTGCSCCWHCTRITTGACGNSLSPASSHWWSRRPATQRMGA
jgi:hypothetical protein